MARRLIESGVRLVSVVAWTGLDPGEKFVSVETWDMHGNAESAFLATAERAGRGDAEV